jgi:Protein of unknown function (DUF2867)
MSNTPAKAAATDIPADSRVARLYPITHLADAYAINLPAGSDTRPESLARFIFAHQAPWVRALMKLRDGLVAGFGLKTSAQLTATDAASQPASQKQRVGIFKIYSSSESEIVLGEDDKHLDFRLSLHCTPSAAGDFRLVLSTAVHCHNRLGRAYIFVIAPFHRRIVRASLEQAARRGWPLS